MIIPNQLVCFNLVLFFISVIYKFTIERNFIFIFDNIIGFILGFMPFFILYLVTKKRGIGVGDIKLFSTLGIIFGTKVIIGITLISILLAGIFSVSIILFKFKNIKSQIPFGPFIIISALLFIFVKDITLNFLEVYFGF